MSERVFIRGQKVVLREKRIEDAPDDFAWRSDEELAKLDATRPLNMTYDDFLRYARTEIDDPGPRSMRLAIDTLDGRHIGNFMYYDLDLRRGEAELGIMIGDRDYWGKGYGSDALRAVQDYIFTHTSHPDAGVPPYAGVERASPAVIHQGRNAGGQDRPQKRHEVRPHGNAPSRVGDPQGGGGPGHA